MADCKAIYTAAFYRPPSCDKQSLESLHESIAQLSQHKRNAEIVLTGDFNLPGLNWNSQENLIRNRPEYGAAVNKKMCEIIEDYNLNQWVKEPTRQQNILDLVFTTNPNTMRNIKVIEGMSDHDAVLTDINMRIKYNRKKPRNIYLYNRADMSSVKTSLKNQYSKFIRNSMEDDKRTINEVWQEFKRILHETMRKYIPQKTLSNRRNLPWLTYEIKRRIRQKQRFYNKARKTNDPNDWNEFRNLRRTVKQMLVKAHTTYVMNLLDMENPENKKTTITKKFWTYIKSQKKDNSGVSPLIENGKTYEDSKGKAQVLNRQFQSVFTEEVKDNIPRMDRSEKLPPINRLCITTAGIEKMLKGIDIKKASGPDEVPCRILKEAAEEISPYLCYIFNMSISTGSVPSDWRSANITCLFKKGERSAAANYRPVSLTSVPCKMLEHIIFRHIMLHLEEHDILVEYQHGFRKKRSCESQLVITMEDVARSMDTRKQIDMLVLDFSKAFDTVAHERLLIKLDHYGIRGNLHHWLRQWPTERNQKVVVDGEESDSVHVKSGVPQGTVLGPLMFLIFVNDIGRKVTSSKLRLFADDALNSLQRDREYQGCQETSERPKST